MSTISLRPQASRVSIELRVVPGTSDTIARSWPRSALTRLDLPTFGRPTKAIAAGSSASAAIAASQRAAPASSLFGVDAVLVGLGLVDHERLQLAGRHFLGPRLGLCLSSFPRLFLLALGRQRPDDRVEQVAGPAPVRSRDLVGLLPAKRVELGSFELALVVVGLVDGDDHR